MWIADNWKDYEVIDTASGEKLERWGDYILVRPDPQVIWTSDKRASAMMMEIARPNLTRIFSSTAIVVLFF